MEILAFRACCTVGARSEETDSMLRKIGYKIGTNNTLRKLGKETQLNGGANSKSYTKELP